MCLSWALLFWGNCHDLCARLETYLNSVKLSTWPISRNALRSVIFVVCISPIWISTRGGHRATYLRVGRGGEWLTAACKLNAWGRKWRKQIWSHLGLAEATWGCSRRRIISIYDVVFAAVKRWPWLLHGSGIAGVTYPASEFVLTMFLCLDVSVPAFHWVCLCLNSILQELLSGSVHEATAPYHFKHSF